VRLTLAFSHDRVSAIVADQKERNSERDNVLEEKQAEVVHVMDAVNHYGVIRCHDQHAAGGENMPTRMIAPRMPALGLK
jgi:hypothetical protein